MGGFSLLFQWLQFGDGNKHSNCHSFLPISKRMHINGFISCHYLFNTYPLLCYSSAPLFVSLYGLSSQCPHPYFSVTFSFSMVSHLCNESSLNALHTLFFTDDCILGCFTLHLELLPPLKHKNEEDKAIYFLTDISSTSETFLMHEGVHEEDMNQRLITKCSSLPFPSYL